MNIKSLYCYVSNNVVSTRSEIFISEQINLLHFLTKKFWNISFNSSHTHGQTTSREYWEDFTKETKAIFILQMADNKKSVNAWLKWKTTPKLTIRLNIMKEGVDNWNYSYRSDLSTKSINIEQSCTRGELNWMRRCKNYPNLTKRSTALSNMTWKKKQICIYLA